MKYSITESQLRGIIREEIEAQFGKQEALSYADELMSQFLQMGIPADDDLYLTLADFFEKNGAGIDDIYGYESLSQLDRNSLQKAFDQIARYKEEEENRERWARYQDDWEDLAQSTFGDENW